MTTSAKKPLTALAIKNMKNNTVLSDISEYSGLRFDKGKTGKVTFIYRYRSPIDDSKLIQIKISSQPNIDLATARVELIKLKQIRAQGICPKSDRKITIASKKRENLVLLEKKNFTIHAMIDLYLREHIEDRYTKDKQLITGARNHKGQREVRRTLYADPVKYLGDISAIDIKSKDVVTLINSIINRGAKVQAGNVLREFNAAFEFAIGRGFLDEDFIPPTFQAKKTLSRSKIKLTSTKGKRYLSDDELGKLFAWLPSCKLPEKAKHIFLLTLYTGCRTGEWCEAKWEDIDFKKSQFKIREGKNMADRNVHLSADAIDILNKIKLNRKYIFTPENSNNHLAQHKLTEYTFKLRKKNLMLDIPRWTPHDLRRTTRTGLAALNCPRDIAEAILGHSKKGIEGTYNLHSYENECKEWLNRWCVHLNRIKINY